MPPPIRYPLPTLMGILLLGLVAWRGGEWLRFVSHTVSARWQRVVEGSPAPASTAPIVVAGPLVRRGLILRDGTPVSARPETKPIDAIPYRTFVDIYDIWPEKGSPSHFRVGPRGPLGWVRSGDCLAWDTRLVLRAPKGRLSLAREFGGPIVEVEAGPSPLPVTAWREGWVEVLLWASDQPWTTVGGKGWVNLERLPRLNLGVLLSTVELPAIIQLAAGAEDSASRNRIRLRAVLGRLVEDVGWKRSDIEIALKALPAPVFERTSGVYSSDQIAALNASRWVDAKWSGLEFRFIPLDALP
jgi:hypothetical protein